MGSSTLLGWGGGFAMVDAGTGTLSGLAAMEMVLDRLWAVFLTHHHPDHAGELPAFFQTLAYGTANQRGRDLYLVGGPGTRRLMEGFAEFYGRWIYGRGFHVHVQEVEGTETLELLEPGGGEPNEPHESLEHKIEDFGPVTEDLFDSPHQPVTSPGPVSTARKTPSPMPLSKNPSGAVEQSSGSEPSALEPSALEPSALEPSAPEPSAPEPSALFSLRVDTFSMEHSPASLAYRFHVGGKSVVFTGDTGPTTKEFVPFAKHADVLVVECSFPDGRELPGHMTPLEVARLAEAVEPGITLITHVYPFHTPEEAVAAVKKKHSGPVQAVHPGLRLTL